MADRTGRRGLYVEMPDADLRWVLRRAAVDRRTTTRQLVGEILRGWLDATGYADAGRPAQGEARRG